MVPDRAGALSVLFVSVCVRVANTNASRVVPVDLVKYKSSVKNSIAPTSGEVISEPDVSLIGAVPAPVVPAATVMVLCPPFAALSVSSLTCSFIKY